MPLFSLQETRAAATSDGMMSKSAVANERANIVESIYNTAWNTRFDIFLSHSYSDAQIDNEVLIGLTKILKKKYGYSVYIDWVVDAELDRTTVTENTAITLRHRMDHSRCLFFVTSDNSSNSKWMPWELGYMDGHNGKVAVLPVVGAGSSFTGQEYLSIYPYVDKTDGQIWINHKNGSNFLTLPDWLAGKQFPIPNL